MKPACTKLFVAIAAFQALTHAATAELVLSKTNLKGAAVIVPENSTAGYKRFGSLLQKRLQQAAGVRPGQRIDGKAGDALQQLL